MTPMDDHSKYTEYLYSKCKELFDTRMNLPEDDPNKWHSFVDYLLHYNSVDTLPLAMTMTKMANVQGEHTVHCQFSYNFNVIYTS